jgi:hypothetical protein
MTAGRPASIELSIEVVSTISRLRDLYTIPLLHSPGF